VKTALELGIPVEVIIPCSHYGNIYDSSEVREEYRHLLSRCQQVHELPFQECSEDAYLAAGHWIVDHSDLVLLVWNGYPAGGKGGTADIATYARSVGCPFIHIHTRPHIAKQYGSLLSNSRLPRVSAKRGFAVQKQTVYQGNVLTVNHYRLQMPGGKVIDSTPDGIWQQVQTELREETGFRAGKLEKLLDFYSHPGYIAHKAHLLVAYDLEWDPLEMEDGEEIRVHAFTLDEALAATREDYRCDPEAALALWLYTGSSLLVGRDPDKPWPLLPILAFIALGGSGKSNCLRAAEFPPSVRHLFGVYGSLYCAFVLMRTTFLVLRCSHFFN